MRFAVLLALLGRAAVAQAPDPAQLFHDAVAAQQRGDDALAAQKYQELLRQHPDVVEVRANLGAALAQLGRYDEAIEQYRAVLARQPDDRVRASVRLNMALAYYKKGDVASAAPELDALHQGDPGNTQIATLLGDCDARLERYKDAIAVLTPVEVARPDDLTVAWVLGAALIHAGRPREGLERVRKAAERGASAEAYFLAGQTLLELNEFEQAHAAADAAIKLNPRLPGLYTLNGKARQYLGDFAGAKADLEKGLAANPEDLDAHVTMAAILNDERDLEGAQRHVESALKINPSSTMARWEHGRIARSRGDLEAAVHDFEEVVRADPNWPRPHIELAALYYRLNRAEDGKKERAIVEKLNAGAPTAPSPSPTAPSP